MNFGKLIERIRLILTTPKTEWPVIAAEPATVGSLYKGYILWVAAIPPICTLLKTTFGLSLFGLGAAGVSAAVVSYVLALITVFIMALIIDALAPTFGGQKDQVQALKTAAYSYTAAWVGALGLVIPWIGWVIWFALSLYSIYLLYLGLPHTMKSPPDKAVGYTVVIIIVGIVLGWIVGLVTAGMMGAAMWSGIHASSISSPASSTFDKDSSMGKLEAWSKKMEDANKKMEAAQKSGDSQQQGEAMSQMMGAVFGGAAGAAAEALPPDRLKAFVPDALAGMPRTEISAERNKALGLQVSNANASYSDGSGHNLRLEITDSGGMSGLMGLASWASVEQERETSSGYEHTRKENGRIVHEQWDRSSNSGEYGVVLGDRFLVKVAGNAASVDDLRAAVAGLDLAGLEALRNEGVKPN